MLIIIFGLMGNCWCWIGWWCACSVHSTSGFSTRGCYILVDMLIRDTFQHKENIMFLNLVLKYIKKEFLYQWFHHLKKGLKFMLIIIIKNNFLYIKYLCFFFCFFLRWLIRRSCSWIIIISFSSSGAAHYRHRLHILSGSYGGSWWSVWF